MVEVAVFITALLLLGAINHAIDPLFGLGVTFGMLGLMAVCHLTFSWLWENVITRLSSKDLEKALDSIDSPDRRRSEGEERGGQ